MTNDKVDFLDLWIVEQRKLYRKEKAISEAASIWYVGDTTVELILSNIYDEKYVMQLPKDFSQTAKELRNKIYTIITEESEVYTNTNHSLFLVLQKIKHEAAKDQAVQYQSQMIETIREEIRGAVIYEQEQMNVNDRDIYRVSYKSLAVDDTVYNESFWTMDEQDIYFGTFQCRFELYDEWMPVIRMMINSINKKVSEQNEGVQSRGRSI